MADSIEISSHIKAVIDRSNVQCRSLAALPEGLFDRFLAKGFPLAVLFKGRPLRGRVRAGIDEENFEIEAPDLVPYLKAGALLLVVFPGPGGRRYVIQARVREVKADGCRVECLDPRYGKRLRPEGEVVVSWRRVPDEVELALREGGLRVFRELAGGVVERVAADEGDRREAPGFEASRGFAVLADISGGGAALFSKEAVDGGLADHLLYIETDKAAPARLGLFAVVRGISGREGGSLIHLMFVARIGEDLAAALAGKAGP